MDPEALKEQQRELLGRLRDLESRMMQGEMAEVDYREARDNLRAHLSEVEADLRLLEMEAAAARARLALGLLLMGAGLLSLAAPGGPLTAESWVMAGPPDRVAASALRFLLPTLTMPGAIVVMGEWRSRSGIGEMPPRLWRLDLPPGEAHRRLAASLSSLGARGVRPGPPLEAAFGLGPTRLRLEVTFRPLSRATEVRVRTWGKPGNWERWKTEIVVARRMVENGLPWEIEGAPARRVAQVETAGG